MPPPLSRLVVIGTSASFGFPGMDDAFLLPELIEIIFERARDDDDRLTEAMCALTCRAAYARAIRRRTDLDDDGEAVIDRSFLDIQHLFVTAEFRGYRTVCHWLWAQAPPRHRAAFRVCWSIKQGHYALADELVALGIPIFFDEVDLVANGYLGVMQWLVNRGIKVDFDLIVSHLDDDARLPILDWVLDQGHVPKSPPFTGMFNRHAFGLLRTLKQRTGLCPGPNLLNYMCCVFACPGSWDVLDYIATEHPEAYARFAEGHRDLRQSLSVRPTGTLV